MLSISRHFLTRVSYYFSKSFGSIFHTFSLLQFFFFYDWFYPVSNILAENVLILISLVSFYINHLTFSSLTQMIGIAWSLRISHFSLFDLNFLSVSCWKKTVVQSVHVLFIMSVITLCMKYGVTLNHLASA